MNKKYVAILLLTLFSIGATLAFVVSQQNSMKSLPVVNSDYNPHYADAIQMKKPELCQNINYALQSGPTDGIDKVYGNPARELCVSQAKEGFFGCECDQDAVLNNMR